MIGGFDVIDIFVRMTHLPQIDSCFHERFVRCPWKVLVNAHLSNPLSFCLQREKEQIKGISKFRAPTHQISVYLPTFGSLYTRCRQIYQSHVSHMVQLKNISFYHHQAEQKSHIWWDLGGLVLFSCALIWVDNAPNNEIAPNWAATPLIASEILERRQEDPLRNQSKSIPNSFLGKPSDVFSDAFGHIMGPLKKLMKNFGREVSFTFFGENILPRKTNS